MVTPFISWLHSLTLGFITPSHSGKLKGNSRLPLMLTGYGTETYIFQTKSPTWPAKKGKDSCEVFTHFLCLHCHAQYFALLNLNMKLQFCGEASLEFPFNFPGLTHCVPPYVSPHVASRNPCNNLRHETCVKVMVT